MSRAAFKNAFLLIALMLWGTNSLLAGSGGFLLTGSVQESFAGDGSVRFRSVSTTAYDVHGRVERVVTTHQVFDRVYSVDTTSNTYDKHGNLLAAVTISEAKADGAVDSRMTTTYTNLDDHVTRSVTLTDFGQDGTIDGEAITTLTYGPRGDLLGGEYERDLNGDGIIDLDAISTWTYSTDRRSLIRLDEIDFPADGVVDATTKFTFALNHRGDPISFTFESSSPTIYSGYGQFGTYAYDKFGNLLQMIGYTLDTDGLARTAFKASYFYEHRGEVIRESNPGSGSPPCAANLVHRWLGLSTGPP